MAPASLGFEVYGVGDATCFCSMALPESQSWTVLDIWYSGWLVEATEVSTTTVYGSPWKWLRKESDRIVVVDFRFY